MENNIRIVEQNLIRSRDGFYRGTVTVEYGNQKLEVSAGLLGLSLPEPEGGDIPLLLGIQTMRDTGEVSHFLGEDLITPPQIIKPEIDSRGKPILSIQNRIDEKPKVFTADLPFTETTDGGNRETVYKPLLLPKELRPIR